MTDPLDPRLTAIEQRLERMSRIEPSPALRHRTIMAVDDVLNEKVTATKSGEARQSRTPFYPDLVAGTFIAGTFIAAGLALAASVMIGISAVRHIRPLAFTERMRIASVPDDGSLAATVASLAKPAAAALPLDAQDSPRRSTVVRVIDARRVLEEML